MLSWARMISSVAAARDQALDVGELLLRIGLRVGADIGVAGLVEHRLDAGLVDRQRSSWKCRQLTPTVFPAASAGPANGPDNDSAATTPKNVRRIEPIASPPRTAGTLPRRANISRRSLAISRGSPEVRRTLAGSSTLDETPC